MRKRKSLHICSFWPRVAILGMFWFVLDPLSKQCLPYQASPDLRPSRDVINNNINMLYINIITTTSTCCTSTLSSTTSTSCTTTLSQPQQHVVQPHHLQQHQLVVQQRYQEQHQHILQQLINKNINMLYNNIIYNNINMLYNNILTTISSWLQQHYYKLQQY